MRITSNLNEAAVLQELGARIARHRLENGLTQAALAMEAGVAKRTLERIEAGHGTELATFIRLLRVLNLTDGLERLVSDQPPSPIALLKSQGRERQRMRTRKSHSAVASLPLNNDSLAAEKPVASASNWTGMQRSKRNKNWTWNE
jgi:transcriptional regulator with XRE-family HTH domain